MMSFTSFHQHLNHRLFIRGTVCKPHLYCLVLYCMVLYRIVLCCIVLCCIVLFCIVWRRRQPARQSRSLDASPARDRNGISSSSPKKSTRRRRRQVHHRSCTGSFWLRRRRTRDKDGRVHHSCTVSGPPIQHLASAFPGLK